MLGFRFDLNEAVHDIAERRAESGRYEPYSRDREAKSSVADPKSCVSVAESPATNVVERAEVVVELAGFVQPETIQPETIQPATIQPATIQPATIQLETIQPETIQLETIQVDNSLLEPASLAAVAAFYVDIDETYDDEAAEPLVDPVDERCIQLEREMIEVAHYLHSSNSKIVVFCPVCDARMAVRDERDVAKHGTWDVKLHRLECTDCGMATGRVFHPSIGYDQIPAR